MNIDFARELLSLLISNKDQTGLGIIYIKLRSELPSQEIIQSLEKVFKPFKVLWAVTRPGLAISPVHVLHVFYHTLKAFVTRDNISNKFNIEFLVRLTCEDQITNALKIAGLDDRAREFCLYIISPNKDVLEESLSALSSLPVEVLLPLNVLKAPESGSLLKMLNVKSDELSTTSYKSSVLSAELKSVLTRMALLKIKR
ncbi:MAG: KEOPS complex subunit Cgi121 [Candidatus Nezhaarchaeales archaeon]